MYKYISVCMNECMYVCMYVHKQVCVCLHLYEHLNPYIGMCVLCVNILFFPSTPQNSGSENPSTMESSPRLWPVVLGVCVVGLLWFRSNLFLTESPQLEVGRAGVGGGRVLLVDGPEVEVASCVESPPSCSLSCVPIVERSCPCDYFPVYIRCVMFSWLRCCVCFGAPVRVHFFSSVSSPKPVVPLFNDDDFVD